MGPIHPASSNVTNSAAAGRITCDSRSYPSADTPPKVSFAATMPATITAGPHSPMPLAGVLAGSAGVGGPAGRAMPTST